MCGRHLSLISMLSIEPKLRLKKKQHKSQGWHHFFTGQEKKLWCKMENAPNACNTCFHAAFVSTSISLAGFFWPQFLIQLALSRTRKALASYAIHSLVALGCLLDWSLRFVLSGLWCRFEALCSGVDGSICVLWSKLIEGRPALSTAVSMQSVKSGINLCENSTTNFYPQASDDVCSHHILVLTDLPCHIRLFRPGVIMSWSLLNLIDMEIPCLVQVIPCFRTCMPELFISHTDWYRIALSLSRNPSLLMQWLAIKSPLHGDLRGEVISIKELSSLHQKLPFDATIVPWMLSPPLGGV